MPERRAYPRIASDLAGMLEFKVSAPSSQVEVTRSVNVPVEVSSISCEGAGVQWLIRPMVRDLPRRRVTLHVAIDSQRHQVPAMVTWSTYPGAGGVARVGLRLELSATPAETRHAFAEWIAVRTAAAQRRSDPGHNRYTRVTRTSRAHKPR